MIIKRAVFVFFTCFLLAIQGCYFDVCSIIERLKDEKIEGAVVDKVRKTSEHDLKYLKVENLNGTETSIYLSGEISDLFEYVQSGDLILKEKGSLNIHIIRGEKIKKFDLKYDFNCR